MQGERDVFGVDVAEEASDLDAVRNSRGARYAAAIDFALALGWRGLCHSGSQA
jgi:hypothetical protein